MNAFDFARKPMTSVPDLSGIKGFNQDKEFHAVTGEAAQNISRGGQEESRQAHTLKSADSNSAPAITSDTATMTVREMELAKKEGGITLTDGPDNLPMGDRPSYFAPQASILRVGENVAVKVVVQTSIRDEAMLEELREKSQDAVTQIEAQMQQRLKEKTAEDKPSQKELREEYDRNIASSNQPEDRYYS